MNKFLICGLVLHFINPVPLYLKTKKPRAKPFFFRCYEIRRDADILSYVSFFLFFNKVL